MKIYTSTLHVDAPPDVAFAFVADPELMGEARGFELTVLEKTPDVTTCRYEIRMLGLPVHGTLTFTEIVPNEKVTLQWQGPHRYVTGDLRGQWTFAPDDGGTTITIRSEFDTHVPVLHALAARATIWSFRRQELPTLKTRIEARAREVQRVS